MPEVTAYFWIIKVLCTTVGETAADLLNEKAGLGLTGVSLLMSALLAVVLVAQFRTAAYRAGVYWPAVALISVVGTLISDNLTDHMGVPLETSTAVFAVVLAIVFAVWYRRERTLSIHSIDSTGRESFYWLAVLFTFALGTAAGDLVSERMDLGYWLSAVLFAAAIAAVAVAHFALGLDAVWSFWIAYVLTRPLGASAGDYLSQPTADGGLGVDTVITSALFLAVILGLVVYLGVTRKDVTEPGPPPGTRPELPRGTRSGCVQALRATVGEHGRRRRPARCHTGRSSRSPGASALSFRPERRTALEQPEVLTDLDVASASNTTKSVMKKLPEVTLAFWIMKIAATTLGETAGDLFAQTLKLGYFLTTIALFLVFVVTLVVQLRSSRYNPFFYWTVILSTSMAGTTMSDFMNRDAGAEYLSAGETRLGWGPQGLGLGYPAGAAVLISVLLAVFAVWKLSGMTFRIRDIVTFRGEALFWSAILVSNTLGTSMGDFLSDSSGLGYAGGALLVTGLLGVLLALTKAPAVPNVLLFWIAFVLTRPLGATAGDFLTKPVAKGGLDLGTAGSSAVLLAVLFALMAYAQVRERRPAAGPGKEEGEREPVSRRAG